MRRQAISSLCERHRVYLHKPRQYSIAYYTPIWYSLLLLDYKPVQLVTVLNTVGNCNTMVSIIIRAKGKGHPRTGHEGPEVEQMYSSSLSLTSALDAGGQSTPRPGHLTPGKDPVPIIGGLVGPSAGLDGGGKSRPHRDSIPGMSSPQRVAIPTELSRPTNIIILWDHRRICVPSLTETSLCGAYLQLPELNSTSSYQS